MSGLPTSSLLPGVELTANALRAAERRSYTGHGRSAAWRAGVEPGAVTRAAVASTAAYRLAVTLRRTCVVGTVRVR